MADVFQTSFGILNVNFGIYDLVVGQRNFVDVEQLEMVSRGDWMGVRWGTCHHPQASIMDDLLKVGLFPGQFPRLHLSPPAGRNSNVAGNRNFSTISSRGLREFYGILRSLFDLCVVFSHIRLLKPMFFETEFPWNQGDLPQFYPFIHGIFPRN